MKNDSNAIVFVASQNGNSSDGGIESATRIFEALVANYRWCLVTTHDTHFLARWRERGAHVSIAALDYGDKGLMLLRGYVGWSSRILIAALLEKPSVIHANDTRALKAAAPVARLLRLPLLLTVRDTKAPGEPYPSHWRQATRICRRIVTLSDEMGDILSAQIGAPRELFYTINSIVDLDQFSPPSTKQRENLRLQLGIGEMEFAVAVIGTIRDKKNQLELIKCTLPELFKKLPCARVHFLGDFSPNSNSYSARCASAAAVLNGRAVFHGHQENIADWCKAVDCIVIGSRHEGLARAMIEGMACGVPIVSFDVCSAREMLTESGAGVVLSQGDYSGLTDVLIGLAHNTALRSDMGIRGRIVAESRFNAVRIAAAWRSVYTAI